MSVSPGIAARPLLGLLILPLWLLTGISCQSSSNSGLPPEAPAESTPAVDTESPGESAPAEPAEEPAGDEQKSRLPVPPAVDAIDVSDLIVEENSLEQNLAAMGDLMRSMQAQYGSRELTEDDPRLADELVRRFYSARGRIIALYETTELDPEEHLELLNSFYRLGPYFNEAAAHHGREYLEGGEADFSLPETRNALALMGDLHVKAGRFPEAAAAYEEYLQIACDPDEESTETGRPSGFCRKVLTQQLPYLYHELGEVEKLELLLEELWARRFDKPRDTQGIPGYLIQDLWKSGNLKRLDSLTREVLGAKAWGSGARSSAKALLVPALSARARLRLVEKGCFAARTVYLDYEFDNSDIEPVWLQQNIVVPSRLLCRPAPALDLASWASGEAPAVQPGTDALDRPVLLHFVDGGHPLSMATLELVGDLARRLGDRAQVITLVKPSEKFWDPATGEWSEEVSRPGGYQAALASYLETVQFPQPITSVPGSETGNALARYALTKFPTLAVVDRENRIVAYHASATYLDPGWEFILRKLAE